MCLGACGEVGVLLREDVYKVGGEFVVDDRLVVFANNVDSKFLNEINKK
jgi:hypothetical protein